MSDILSPQTDSNTTSLTKWCRNVIACWSCEWTRSRRSAHRTSHIAHRTSHIAPNGTIQCALCNSLDGEREATRKREEQEEQGEGETSGKTDRLVWTLRQLSGTAPERRLPDNGRISRAMQPLPTNDTFRALLQLRARKAPIKANWPPSSSSSSKLTQPSTVNSN